MTNEEMDRAIAEHLGWKCQSHVPHENKAGATMCWIRPGNHEWHPEQIPCYSTDLNAMHEAEKTLPKHQRSSYVINLVRVTPLIKEKYSFHNRFLCATYTAHQRAEAFLRTVGKYIEPSITPTNAPTIH